MKTTIVLFVEENGEELELDFPSKFEVCPECGGHGTHLTPAIRDHAYTREEFDEVFFDDEDREAYFTRGGMYDVTCECCNGQRVVEVVDEERLTDIQRAQYAKWECQQREAAEDAAEYAAEREAERRFGC